MAKLKDIQGKWKTQVSKEYVDFLNQISNHLRAFLESV